MYYVTLADGTKFSLLEEYSLNNLVYLAKDEDEALTVSRSLTRDTLSHVEFSQEDGTVYGSFDNLMLNTAPMRQDEEDGKVRVIISLRPATDLELRVQELEETQAIQDGAIEEIAEIVAEG